MYDLLIKNGMIVDGTGKQRYLGDIAVKDGKIAQIGCAIEADAKTVINAEGKIVSPGFIDSHTHSDTLFLAGTTGYNYLEQGTTTEITGPCGGSAAPYYDGLFRDSEWMYPPGKLEELIEASRTLKGFMQAAGKCRLGTNMGFLVGQGTIRGRVMGFSMAEPTAEQLEQMRGYVREAIEAGMLGISTGLVYPPSVYAGEKEITELVKVAAQLGGVYSSHIRGEDARCADAVAEAIRIGENAGAPVVISHHKIMGMDNAGLSEVTLKMVSDANERGVKVRLDQYPFLAGVAGLIDAMPPSSREQGLDALLERLKDAEYRKEMTEVLKNDESFQNYPRIGGFGKFLILMAHDPALIGKTVLEVANERSCDPYDTFYDLLIEANGAMTIAYVIQVERDMLNILQYKYTMPGSDMSHNAKEMDPETVGGWHPRGTATMTRHLELIRDHGLLSLEDAIHRMTWMPADFYGLKDRGVLREGAFADICIFDYAQVRAHCDFVHPFRRNTGIETVIVNGEIAVEHGRFNGTLAGSVLTKK